jgi:regulation of enolase protein 1 (concanavalin A-like superfamily)
MHSSRLFSELKRVSLFSGKQRQRGVLNMHETSRRRFTTQMLTLTGAALLGDKIFRPAAMAAAKSSAGGELIGRMKWLNEPASATISEGKLVVRAKPKTDFWRKTFYGYITDNGHFFHLPVSGDFVFEARVDGQYAALYDQAGLMVRIDAQNWVKCGTEFFDNARHASVVFTREFSDWSTMSDLATSGPVWWRVVRKPDSLETLCSADGKNFTSVRMGYLLPSASAEVGIMCAAPEGSGFQCAFDNLKLTAGGK